MVLREPAAVRAMSRALSQLCMAVASRVKTAIDAVEVRADFSVTRAQAHAMLAALPRARHFDRFAMIEGETGDSPNALIVVACGVALSMAQAPLSLAALSATIAAPRIPCLVTVPFDIERAAPGTRLAYTARVCLTQRAAETLRVVVDLQGAPIDVARAQALTILEAVQRSVDASKAAVGAATIGDVELSHDPSRPRHHAIIEAITDAISQGTVRKVVVARATRIACVGLDAVAALTALHTLEPVACAYLFDERTDVTASVFVGATPEWLYRRAAQRLTVDVLAGTVRRGSDDAQDRHLQAQLLASAKDQHENDVVNEEVMAAMRSLCTQTEAATPPRIKRLARVAHLYRQSRGLLRLGSAPLSVLHPTSAVCGDPRVAALALVRSTEVFARGHYAGVVGVCDGDTHDLAVALRCASIEVDAVTLFAGGGVVRGSRADVEWQELNDKIGAWLTVLGVRDVSGG